MFTRPWDLADDSRPVCLFLEASCTPASSSPSSLKCGHRKEENVGSRPTGAVKAPLQIVIYENALFSRGAEDPKITFHSWGVEFGGY